MFLTKLKIAALVVVAVAGLLGTGAGLLLTPAPADEPAGRPVQADRAAIRGGAAQAVKPEQLRYGGKSFDEWRTVLLTDLKPEVRVEAINALSAFGPNGYASEAIAAIITVMRTYQDVSGRDQDAFKVSVAGVKGIARIGAVAMPVLVNELKGGERNGRRFAVLAVQGIGADDPKVVLPTLAEALKDGDVEVRRLAVQAVRELDAEGTSVPALAKVLANAQEDPFVRSIALAALTNLGPKAKPAIPALVAAAKDRNLPIRLKALNALVSIKPDAGTVLPVLTAALKDEDRDVRIGAAQIVESLGASAKEAVPALLAALKGAEQDGERVALVNALGAIGPAAQEAAAPVLLGILAGENPQIPSTSPDVYAAVRSALKRMESSK